MENQATLQEFNERRFNKLECRKISNKPFQIGTDTYMLYQESKDRAGVLVKVAMEGNLHRDNSDRVNPIRLWSVFYPGSLIAALDIPDYLKLINS